MIDIFDIENKIVIPSKNCYLIDWLKVIMEKYPNNYIKVYSYIFFMSCTNKENPYFNVKETDREEIVRRDIDIDFDTDDMDIEFAIERCKELYETRLQRFYISCKNKIDKFSEYLDHNEITDGREGNITQQLKVLEQFEKIRDNFKKTSAEFENETNNLIRARGGQTVAYDMK